MSDLVAFVRACLDADEQAARVWDSDGRARIAVVWTGPEPGYTTAAIDHADDVWVADGREVEDPRHVTIMYDPARVLAEVAAKRAILDLHESWPVLVETPPEFTSDTADITAVSFSMSQRMMWLTQQEYRARFGDEPPTAPIVRLLAQPYEGEDGWDPAWKVE